MTLVPLFVALEECAQACEVLPIAAICRFLKTYKLSETLRRSGTNLINNIVCSQTIPGSPLFWHPMNALSTKQKLLFVVFFGSEPVLNVLAQDGVDVMVEFIKETVKPDLKPEWNTVDLMFRNISRIAFKSKRTSKILDFWVFIGIHEWICLLILFGFVFDDNGKWQDIDSWSLQLFVILLVWSNNIQMTKLSLRQSSLVGLTWHVTKVSSIYFLYFSFNLFILNDEMISWNTVNRWANQQSLWFEYCRSCHICNSSFSKECVHLLFKLFLLFNFFILNVLFLFLLKMKRFSTLVQSC